jgi:hypothetical protein
MFGVGWNRIWPRLPALDPTEPHSPSFGPYLWVIASSSTSTGMAVAGDSFRGPRTSASTWPTGVQYNDFNDLPLEEDSLPSTTHPFSAGYSPLSEDTDARITSEEVMEMLWPLELYDSHDTEYLLLSLWQSSHAAWRAVAAQTSGGLP